MEINSIKKINQSVCVPVCLSVRLSVCSQICVHDISSVSVGGSLVFLQIGSVSRVACLKEIFKSKVKVTIDHQISNFDQALARL